MPLRQVEARVDEGIRSLQKRPCQSRTYIWILSECITDLTSLPFFSWITCLTLSHILALLLLLYQRDSCNPHTFFQFFCSGVNFGHDTPNSKKNAQGILNFPIIFFTNLFYIIAHWILGIILFFNLWDLWSELHFWIFQIILNDFFFQEVLLASLAYLYIFQFWPVSKYTKSSLFSRYELHHDVANFPQVLWHFPLWGQHVLNYQN